MPGQSFNFIQSPKVYKVTFVGDTLGQRTTTGCRCQTQYAKRCIRELGEPASNTGYGLRIITNVTEPAQELIVTSPIPNAFSYGGQTCSSMTYLLTPYGDLRSERHRS